MPVIAHYDFNDADHIANDSATDNGNQFGYYLNGAQASGGEAVLDGDNDLVKIFPNPVFQMDRGTLEIRFNLSDEPLTETQTVLSRDSVGETAGGYHIDILADGSVVVSHESTGGTTTFTTGPGFANPGDHIELTYSWDHGGNGGALSIDNTTTNAGFSANVPNDLTMDMGGIDQPWVVGAGQATSDPDMLNNIDQHFSGSVDMLEFSDTSDNCHERDGIIWGTPTDDLIDVGYTGDNDGDMVDANDAIIPGDGPNDDRIFAGDGDDTVIAGEGNDLVDGGEGNDRIVTIGGLPLPDIGYPGLYPADADPTDDLDTVNGGTGNDTIITGDDADLITGGYGNDQIDGGVDADTIFGNIGDDTIIGAEGSDSIEAGYGDDLVYGGYGPNVPDAVNIRDDQGDLAPDNGRDFINGGIGNDTLFGMDDDDTIFGGQDNDLVVAGIDDDLVDGGSGEDSLFGGQGNDTMVGGQGGDGLAGGEGNDSLGGGAGNDEVFGSDGDDAFAGGEGDDLLSGGSGNDSAAGGGGNDFVTGDGGNDLLAGDQGSDGLFGGEGNDTVEGGADSDIIDGGLGDDLLDGGDGADIVAGGDGADTLIGGSDADVLTAGSGDLVEGGSAGDDRDILDLREIGHYRLVDVVTDSDGNGMDGRVELLNPDGTVSGTIRFSNIERILPGATVTANSPDTAEPLGPVVYSNEILGTNGADSIDGTVGNDGIVALAGDDTIDAGSGSDLVFAGDGDDSVSGGLGADILAGQDGNDTILGGGDGDLLSGGEGDDLLDGGVGGDEIEAGAGNDTVQGGSGDDALSGGDGDDSIEGSDGDDDINGGAGNDTLAGGEGFDIVAGGLGNDVIDGGEGADLLAGGDDADSFTGGVGDLVFGGSGGTDNDTLDLTGLGSFRIVDVVTDSDGNGTDGLVEFLDGAGNVTGTLTYENIENVIPCFTPGTLIATPKGEMPVELLKAGDKVVTRDNGIQEIGWVGQKALGWHDLLANPHLKPVMIRQGSLGNGLPERDMLVSPNHRMLVANDRTALYFDEHEVLVSAKHLVAAKGIDTVDSVGTTYIHFMFDRHEVVLANGAWTESFQPGDYTLQGMGNAQRNEIFDLFPDLKTEAGRQGYAAARRTLKRHEALLIAR